MDHIPVGSILMLLVFDVAIVVGLSVAAGASFARASDSALWKGAGVGLVAPVVGPLIWGVVALARDRSRGRVQRVTARPVALIAVFACLVVATLLFLVGMGSSWGHTSAGYQEYRFAVEGSLADSGVGGVAAIATAAVAALAAAVSLVVTAWRRVAFLVLTVGATWLVVTVDGLILFRAIRPLSESVDGLSGGRAAADSGAGAGLWLALLGAVLMVVAGLVLGWLPREGTTGVRTSYAAPAVAAVAAPVTQAPAAATTWGSADWGMTAGTPPSSDAAPWGGTVPDTSSSSGSQSGGW